MFGALTHSFEYRQAHIGFHECLFIEIGGEREWQGGGSGGRTREARKGTELRVRS